ncbi:RtcB family protein [Caldichromatium japonicum]|uniref:3'-phosphate/5'-hydroxy nucleic acid ligase n=1 Tax=Caldichromatium japonicum TaxID=2699430 RepID=A0A6G7VB92_9GAMM|nr:RtcB family protein [Caldichromatium japonicum]QIK37343.1 RtcB family protein [Caldichromatium japonicum]
MPIQQVIAEGGKPIKVWTQDLDEVSRAQLINISRLPFIHHHVAAMPDVHAGIGATIGSVIATRGAIIPAAVGVDIGCGMAAVRTSLTAEQIDERVLRRVYDQICRDVPAGREQHSDTRAPHDAAKPFAEPLQAMLAKHPKLLKSFGKHANWVNQLGTLGSGNHFIEVCLDESGKLWVMLHTGSRGIGNAMATYFIELAQREIDRQRAQLPDRDLAYFSEDKPYFKDYLEAVDWAQRYARANRNQIMRLVLSALKRHLPPFTLEGEVIDCHHNYVERERHLGAKVWVTRKGAIRAGKGELGIVPGSMGTQSYIVRGLGNPESFCSSAHGAGRCMSRNAAAKQFTPADLAAQTQGVICRKDKHVLDEIPAAYKEIDQVMTNQSDLVEVVYTLKQVVCIKG